MAEARDVAALDVLALALPADVGALARRLRAHGRVWVVGGAVRDALLRHPVHDWDLATDLPPAVLASLLPEADARDQELGAFRLPRATGGAAVVTTLRTEADYREHRRPGRVTFIDDPLRDAQRRDFTCNAIYWDPVAGVLLDPTGGIADLRRGRLRAIGDPATRFTEDALRLLRLVRFAARCGLEVESQTAAAARGCAALAAHLSAERVYGELTAVFTARGRGRGLRLLHELGLTAVLLPEVAAMAGVTQPPEYHPEGDVLVHTILVLDHVPPGDAALAWAAVLHDVGKPPTWRQAEDRIRFDGHDTLSAKMADAILRRLHAPAAVREAVVDLAQDHIRFAALPAMRPRRREEWLRQPGFWRHLLFHRADCLGSHADLRLYRQAIDALRALPPERTVLVAGADALALGVPEGPLVGEVLRRTHDLADQRGIGDRPAALVLLREVVAGAVKRSDPDGR